MTAQVADQLCLWIAIVVPIPLIIAFRWLGVALGVFVVWGSLFIAGALLSALDPNRTGLLDGFWLCFGWIAGLIYCVPIFGLRELVAWHVQRSRRSRG